MHINVHLQGESHQLTILNNSFHVDQVAIVDVTDFGRT